MTTSSGTLQAQGQPPGAPTLVAVQVSANPVTLRWSAGAGGPPSNYLIVAGTNAATADIGTFPVGLATAVTANAPTGITIFVRVVAVNAAGSASSNQIRFAIGAPAGTIPQQATYRAQVSGDIVQSGGITSTFSVAATVLVVPTIDPGAIGVRNGPNPIDVGLFTDASPLLGTAGALSFGTNTAFCRFIGCSTAAAAIDTTFVSVNPAQGLVNIAVDGNVFGLPTARLSIFNIFNARTSIVAQIYNILSGQMVLQFANNTQTVSGAIAFGGSSGFSGPFVSTVYRATLNGFRVR